MESRVLCGFPSLEGGDDAAPPNIAIPPSERHFHSELSNLRQVSLLWFLRVTLGTKCGISRTPRRTNTLTDSCSEPKNHRDPPIVRPYGRLKLVGAGLALAVVGCALLLKGVQVVTHWTGQPMFSWGLVAAGGLCIVLAVIPASWIVNAGTTHSKTARYR